MDNYQKGFYSWFGVTARFDPENRFVASPFISPVALGIIRILFALYMTCCIIIDPILLKKGRRTRRDATKFPGYFTNITFISLAWYYQLNLTITTSYFWVSGIYSLIYGLTGISPLRKLPRFLQLLHSIFYSTVTTFPFLVTAVFWSLISSPPHKKAFSTVLLQWTNISFHCLNSVLAFIELIFSAVTPQKWTHSLVILIIMVFYIAMAYIIHLTANFYVYDFMDSKIIGPLTAAYIFGIGGLGVITFFVVQMVVWVKFCCCGAGLKESKFDVPRWEDDRNEPIEVSEIEPKQSRYWYGGRKAGQCVRWLC